MKADVLQIKPSQQYQANMKQILYLCQMSENELAAFMTETAETWLSRYFNNVVSVEEMLMSDGFIRWWKMHWYDQDDRFYLKEIYDTHEPYRYCRYRQLHQSVFAMCQPTTLHMYNDFLDMYKSFS